MKSLIKHFANANILVGVVLMVLPVLYLVTINTPQIWYRVNPNAVQDEIDTLTENPFAETFGSFSIVPKVFAEAKPADASLPKQNTIRVNGIGINTQILEGPEEASLEKGVWRMPQYGTPLDNDKPVILAAHRWGPVNISAEYRNRNMFINLPNLKPGDDIEIIWDQQIFKYKVRKVETVSHVSQLSDLILITCKYFDSPERIMVYAERVA